MASIRTIKRRIKSVGTTKQTTKAMKLVSTSKLQKARIKLKSTRPFFLETQRVIASIVNNSKGIKHPYLIEREVKKIAIVLLTSDRGLCGGFNSNICKEAARFMDNKPEATMVIVGSKGRDYFKRRGTNIQKSYVGIAENPLYDDASSIGREVLNLYTSGEVDEVYIAYSEFESVISNIPKVVKMLPVDTSEFNKPEGEAKDLAIMNYEPDEESVLDYVIPKYINTVIYGALVESATCKQGATMTSMDAATDNAEDIISTLTLVYNRARQGAITQEITEIVSGANALE